jgi:prepilin-type N-terminal cleavage/methylation domain-containing protein
MGGTRRSDRPGMPRSGGGRRRGYTLVELLIVIALLGLAGMIVVPSLSNKSDTDVQAAVRKLIGDLSFAQSDALARQSYRRVHFFADGSGYCIVNETAASYATAFDPAVADYVHDPLGSPGSLGRYIIDYGLDTRFRDVAFELVEIDGDGRDLVFDPIGGTVQAGDTPGSGGTIVLRGGDTAFQITVAAFTGKLSVRRLTDAELAVLMAPGDDAGVPPTP